MSVSMNSSNSGARRMRGLRLLAGALVVALPVSVAVAVAGTTETESLSNRAMLESTAAMVGFADLVERVSPAVVNVSTTQLYHASSYDPERGPDMRNFPQDGPFGEFYKRFWNQHMESPERDRPERMSGVGSGFIIDPDGFIVTNDHVIDDAETIEVTLSDGRRYEAEVIGADEKTDLALLKIAADRPLPFVSFGEEDETRIGDLVIAVGNPFGLGGTVTAGIVSARGRDLGAGPFDDYLQVDAPINRGNSGGPLFNVNGEVIGVNSAIFSPNGGSVGIGFAIPASLVKPVVTQIEDFGEVRRGWLGVHIQTVTDDIAKSLGMELAVGALVVDVEEDSPAAMAGLAQGDVIVGFDGREVTEMRDLPRMVADMAAGETVSADIWRDGGSMALEVAIGILGEDEDDAEDEEGAAEEADESEFSLGLTIAPMTAEARAYYEVEEEIGGVIVGAVESGSIAAEKGLRPGDVIVKLGKTLVTSPEELVATLKEAREAERETVLFLINRDGRDRYVAMDAHLS